MTIEEDTAAIDCANRAFGLRHKALRNALYHGARRGWLDGWSRLYTFVVILGGTGTAADLVRSSSTLTLILGAIITSIGALQLVFDFSGRARNHELLQKRYFELMAEIEGTTVPTIDLCARWDAEVTKISADEPPTLRVLDTIADNQATAALLPVKGPRLKVTWWQSITRHVFPHNSAIFTQNNNWRLDDA
jgi:hypothetical protein